MAKFYEYTYNGITCKATRRRASSRDDKVWERTVRYGDNERTVHYADPNLPMRRNDPDARRNFLARHNCDEKSDPFAPGFWSCYDWANPDEKAEGDERMERKVFNFDVKAVDANEGTFEGYAAVFGNIDQGGDIIHPGAFRKTLSERGGRIKVLWQHNPAVPIGKPIEMYEDAHGLYVKAKVSDTSAGRDVLTLMRDGVIDQMSIGYNAIKGGTDYSKDDATGETVRNLREIKLYEFSPVTFAMNERASINGVKRVSGNMQLPLAPRERPWDSTAAETRVRSWAGGGDDTADMDWARYRQAFFWYDAENAENVTSYKLPFADVIGGELHAVPRGIFACVGGRGVDSADIPAGDKEAIKGRIGEYYARMREEFDDDTLTSPFDKADNPDVDTKAGRVLSAENENRIRQAMSLLQEALDAAGLMDMPDADEDEEMGKSQQQVGSQPDTAPTSTDAGTPPDAAPTDDDLMLKLDVMAIEIENMEV